jgi:hypothetical protein
MTNQTQKVTIKKEETFAKGQGFQLNNRKTPISHLKC